LVFSFTIPSQAKAVGAIISDTPSNGKSVKVINDLDDFKVLWIYFAWIWHIKTNLSFG
jgi:hypothetical protein